MADSGRNRLSWELASSLYPCQTPSRREDRQGSIAPGKLADLVVLDRDPLTIAPEALDQVQAIATMLGGEWVYRA
jgi:predicted amidohydrolase YtcJ